MTLLTNHPHASCLSLCDLEAPLPRVLGWDYVVQNVSFLPSPRVAKLAVENSGNHDSIGTFSVNISTWMLILCGQKVGLVHHLRSAWINGYLNANHALINHEFHEADYPNLLRIIILDSGIYIYIWCQLDCHGSRCFLFSLMWSFRFNIPPIYIYLVKCMYTTYLVMAERKIRDLRWFGLTVYVMLQTHNGHEHNAYFYNNY